MELRSQPSTSQPRKRNRHTEQKAALKKHYVPINTGHMKKLRPDAFLDMITPCVFEIEKDVYPDPRAVFTKKEIHTEFALALMTYFLGIKVD